LAANSRNIPFIHFIEILLHDQTLVSLFRRVIGESDYTNRFGEMHLNRDTDDISAKKITP
jgi:hypothetical protein